MQDTSGSLCFIYNPLKLKLLLFNKKILYRMVPYISGETLYLWTSATWPKLRQFAIPTLFYPFHPYLPYMPHFIQLFTNFSRIICQGPNVNHQNQLYQRLLKYKFDRMCVPSPRNVCPSYFLSQFPITRHLNDLCMV